MGCGLRKMKPTSGEKSPGKIYSTLKRPQVETKVGVAYTYRYLDFLIGKDGGTSTLRLSSVRELPEQLQELYQQGFHLAAIHPFIHPCGPESNSPQHQLYRAILVQINDGVDRRQAPCPPCRLQLEQCVPAEQVPTTELIQGYVKKQIQDAADQGVTFVGFVQEPYGAPCTMIREPDTPSLSLHSSPSSVLGSLGSRSPSNPCSPARQGDSVKETDTCKNSENQSEAQGEVSAASSPISEELTEEDSQSHNNNKEGAPETRPRTRYLQRSYGAELLALYNHPAVREGNAVKYYTVKVPLRVHASVNGADDVREVEANWLDHMTQHFNNGASLVDGHFHLGNSHDLLPKSVESIFVFQEGGEGEANTTYDAIVVEQWTVIDGLQVKADYVPLLQSLATYGWRLTCVLPTPVIKTNSDGSLATKQIVFLQRPVLGRKRRESKKLIFKPRGKANKNGIKDKGKKTKPKLEKDAKIPDYSEKLGNKEDEGRTAESKKMHEEDEKIDDASAVKVETVQNKEEAAEVEDVTEKEMPEVDEEGLKESFEKTDTQEVTDTATEETVVGQEVEALVENGVEMDEDENEDEEDHKKCKTEESVVLDVTAKDTVAASQAPTMNEIPQE
ncbi:raftlin-like isoform X2 [Corythoichthys intestinalis]|uniref:raftlin-like isoform X2 n=1 Tax=Corythoichthys intestinalis TaxID=161448 RepID=UPI0025A521D0|nr:raftlin-like isoform X2 [Corythoichthys intestinalis]XP_061788936.1 raftlin-like [Nerophis lumbriciformis]